MYKLKNDIQILQNSINKVLKICTRRFILPMKINKKKLIVY